MPSPEVLEFAKLLAPISVEKPTGMDPRGDPSNDSAYFGIKEARRSARDAERQAAMQGTAAPVDPIHWKKVRQIAVEVLEKKAKDLEFTAYLLEALIRQDGFAGLRDGLRLARELVEKFWDGLYPLPDEEDGLLARTRPLAHLNGEGAEGTLVAPIARVPLTAKTSLGQLAQVHHIEAQAFKKVTDPKEKQRKEAAGAMTPDKFAKAVLETPAPFYRGLNEELTACIHEATRLGEALNERFAHLDPPISPPSVSKIRDALTECLDTVKQLAGDKLAPASAATAPAGPAGAGTAPVPAPPAPAAIMHTREQALQNLEKVAEFFRRTEPHSPVSYALEQVVRWGGMPLPELWTELIADEAPRKNVFKLVGIRSPK